MTNLKKAHRLGEQRTDDRLAAQTHRVGVYGTLKRGQSNHRVLAGSPFVGRCLLSQITLYDIGPYPGAKLQPSQGVEVEVYEVSDSVFWKLDRLEDYNPRAPSTGEYDRQQLDTPFGAVWVYLFNPNVSGLPVIRRGGWPQPAIKPTS